MFSKSIHNPGRTKHIQRRVIRKAGALPPDRQSLTAVYALGIRDGLKIAADIREKTRRAEEARTHE